MRKNFRLAFEKLGLRILNRSVKVITFDTPDELAGYIGQPDGGTCHVLYIPASETLHAKEWIQVTGTKPIPLFSDDPGFIGLGGDVSLVPHPSAPGRFQYHLHKSRLTEKNIRFNSGFLRLRSTVKVITENP